MLESITLKKLDGYTKPVKTKQLAERIGIDRTTMAEVLNKLHAKDLISWRIPQRNDEKQYVGWVTNRQPTLTFTLRN